jgi:hypothetical protein
MEGRAEYDEGGYGMEDTAWPADSAVLGNSYPA